MQVHSTRLGELEVQKESLIQFAKGVLGFSKDKTFALIPYKLNSPFAYLQSTTSPDLTFLVVDPFVFFADYEFELADALAAQLGFDDKNPPVIYTIVTVPEKTEEMTANLLAPLIIDGKSRAGAQIVLEKGAYTVKHRLFPQGFPTEQGGKGGK